MKRLTAGLAATLVGLALALAGCAERTPQPPDDTPPGALLAAHTGDLARLLRQLARLEGTPLARHARALAARLPSCEVVEAHAPSGGLDALLAGLRCRPQASALEALHRERGARALAFAWPLEPGLRLRGRLALDAQGSVELELRVPREAARGARALLLPGAEPAGPGVLSGSEILLHARVRPEAGLDLASLIPAGGQADHLFRLKSRLFAGTVLDGTWEAAAYLPGAGEPMPRVALALGFVRRRAAVAAIEGFVDELRRTWPLRRSDFALGEATGACLLDLRILPAFAPCYVATERALVVGWNPASLRKALDGVRPPALADAGGLLVELQRFAEADARLAQAGGPGAAARPTAYPWRRLRADGKSDPQAVRLRVRLEGRSGA
jgi:hypothetical protein